MAAPADPALVARAVRLVADGLSYRAAAEELGVSRVSVRKWSLQAGTLSVASRLDLAAWEASKVYQPARPRRNAGKASGGRNGGKPGLYIGFTGDDEWDYRPSPADVRDPVALEAAMSRWHTRARTEALPEERALRSNWNW